MTESEFYKWAASVGLKVTPDCSGEGGAYEFVVIDTKRVRRTRRNMNQCGWHGHMTHLIAWMEEK